MQCISYNVKLFTCFIYNTITALYGSRMEGHYFVKLLAFEYIHRGMGPVLWKGGGGVHCLSVLPESRNSIHAWFPRTLALSCPRARNYILLSHYRGRYMRSYKLHQTIGGDPGGDVSPPPRIFLGGLSPPPLDFWKLEKYLFIYLHFKHNESNTKRLIQHKNTTKHTKSLNLPRADSRPNHISASLALPAISVAGGWGWGGGRAGGQFPPTPNDAFSEFCRYISKFVATCKPTSMSFVPTKCLKYQQNIERNSSFL